MKKLWNKFSKSDTAQCWQLVFIVLISPIIVFADWTYNKLK